MNGSKLAPALAAVAALGIVGGIAAAQAFKPAEKPQRQVQFVQPAGETVAPTTTTPSPTTTTAAPVKPVKIAVESTPTATTTSAAPKPVQRQAVVSSDPSTSTSTQTSSPKPAPFGTNPVNGAPNPPPIDRGTNDQTPPPVN
jgi:hypothetical protein